MSCVNDRLTKEWPSDLFWLNGLVREFWAVEGVEDGLLVGGDGGGVGLGGAVDREGR
jgi:hypothetical protein